MWTRDNLNVLRGLNSESIDLVYADPPFNSNKNYESPIGSKAAGAAFKDTWTLTDVGRRLARGDRRAATEWPTRPWPTDAVVIGEVRWVWHTLP